MRIELKTEGGFAVFPGLSKPISIDTGTLPQHEAAEIEQIVTSARFFDRAPQVGAPPSGAADYRQYTITIDDGRRHHAVRLTDPVEDPQLAALLTLVQAKARALRAPENRSSPD